jgi:hypothetical protein
VAEAPNETGLAAVLMKYKLELLLEPELIVTIEVGVVPGEFEYHTPLGDKLIVMTDPALTGLPY